MKKTRNSMCSKRIAIVSLLFVVLFVPAKAKADSINPTDMIGTGMYKVSSTAYYGDEITSTGIKPIVGITVAGAKEWENCTVTINECNEDGSVGAFVGYFIVQDTGYGRDGDIRRGETIDIFMNTYDECMQYGRRDVYIQLIREETNHD